MSGSVHCPVCSGQSRKISKLIGPGYMALRCMDCRFAWIDRGSIEKVGVSPNYDNYAYNRNLTEQYQQMENLYRRGFQKRVSRSMAYLGGSRSPHDLAFLDVGCANGEYLQTAKSVGIDKLFGVEIDREARVRASAFGEVVSSRDELEGKKFDIIQIKNVLSNIDEFDAFLSSYTDLLASPGVLWLDLLNQDALLSVLRNVVKPNFRKSGRFGPLRPPYVINGFTKSAVRALAKKQSIELYSIQSSYLGSEMVPYSPPGKIAQTVRIVSSYLGVGSMLVCDFVRR